MIDSSIFKMIENEFSSEIADNLKNIMHDNPVYGLRLNPYKKQDLSIFKGNHSSLNPRLLIPKDYSVTVSHPFHHGGVYYIQDPSSTVAVEHLDLNPDDVVIDLCAAPGGKSSQILSTIDKGFLIANEIDPKRNKKLRSNLMRWGVENYSVSQEDGRDLAFKLDSCFDKVMLDAPCSGEGLIRRKKDYNFVYNEKQSKEYQKLQIELLKSAHALSRNEGIIVYSTCTLNPIENEEVILQFLKDFPQCSLMPVDHPLKHEGLLGLHECARFFPSKDGEGQFIAKIKVKKENKNRKLNFSKYKETRKSINDINFDAMFRLVEGNLYAVKNRGFLSEKVKIKQDGCLIASEKKSRLEFHHHLSQSISFSSALDKIELSLEEAYRYLHGLTLDTKKKGYYIVTYQGINLGLAKGNTRQLNNHYPKKLRNRFASYP